MARVVLKSVVRAPYIYDTLKTTADMEVEVKIPFCTLVHGTAYRKITMTSTNNDEIVLTGIFCLRPWRTLEHPHYHATQLEVIQGEHHLTAPPPFRRRLFELQIPLQSDEEATRIHYFHDNSSIYLSPLLPPEHETDDPLDRRSNLHATLNDADNTICTYVPEEPESCIQITYNKPRDWMEFKKATGLYATRNYHTFVGKVDREYSLGIVFAMMATLVLRHQYVHQTGIGRHPTPEAMRERCTRQSSRRQSGGKYSSTLTPQISYS